jgi:hypothetical protein
MACAIAPCARLQKTPLLAQLRAQGSVSTDGPAAPPPALSPRPPRVPPRSQPPPFVAYHSACHAAQSGAARAAELPVHGTGGGSGGGGGGGAGGGGGGGMVLQSGTTALLHPAVMPAKGFGSQSCPSFHQQCRLWLLRNHMEQLPRVAAAAVHEAAHAASVDIVPT